AIRGLETVRLDASRRGSRKRRRTVNSRCRFPNRTCGARCSYAVHAWPSSEQAASVSLLASLRTGFWWCSGNLTDQAQPVESGKLVVNHFASFPSRVWEPIFPLRKVFLRAAARNLVNGHRDVAGWHGMAARLATKLPTPNTWLENLRVL